MPTREELLQLNAQMEELQRWSAERENAPIATRNALWKLNELADSLNLNTDRLNDHVIQVEDALHDFHKASDRSAKVLIWLTAAIVLLTVVLLGLTVVLAR